MTEEAAGMDLRDSALKSMADDVAQIKENQKVQAEKIDKLERADLIKEHRINDLSDKLSRIDENTTWLKRTITNALIGGGIGMGFTIAASIAIWVITTQ